MTAPVAHSVLGWPEGPTRLLDYLEAVAAWSVVLRAYVVAWITWKSSRRGELAFLLASSGGSHQPHPRLYQRLKFSAARVKTSVAGQKTGSPRFAPARPASRGALTATHRTRRGISAFCGPVPPQRRARPVWMAEWGHLPPWGSRRGRQRRPTSPHDFWLCITLRRWPRQPLVTQSRHL